MSEYVQVIFHRIAGFGVSSVIIRPGVERETFKGTEVEVIFPDRDMIDFFFPDYAGMTDVEMAEVIANNLREELWNSQSA